MKKRYTEEQIIKRELVQIAGRGESGNESMARALQPCSPE